VDAAESLTPSVDEGAEPVDGLSRRECEILAFERQWWKYAGAKEQAIRDLFDMSATRYYRPAGTTFLQQSRKSRWPRPEGDRCAATGRGWRGRSAPGWSVA
jgi:hypothetical protein